MAEDTGAPRAKGKPDRGRRGFRQAGALIAAQTQAAAARRGYLDARIKALWPEIAGPEIAAVALPVKLTPARGPAGGLLALGVLGANGPQVQMLLPVIAARVNAALGPGAVGRIQIAQSGLAAPPPPPAPPAPPPAPPDISTLAAPLSSIGDPDLRAALETLARNVVSRRAKRDAAASSDQPPAKEP